jgi:hypothetical protein
LAIFLTWKKEGTAGLRHLGCRIVQVNIGWRWYLAAVLVVILATMGQLVIITERLIIRASFSECAKTMACQKIKAKHQTGKKSVAYIR